MTIKGFIVRAIKTSILIGLITIIAFIITTPYPKAAPIPQSSHYTYEGSLSPTYFLNWDKLGTSTFTKDSHTYLYIMFSNPVNADITIVSAIFDKFNKKTLKPTGPVLKYSYRYTNGHISSKILTLIRQPNGNYKLSTN